MIGLQERAIAEAPSTYQEWLDCFERMKEVPLSNNRDLEVLSLGTFAGAGTMQAAFERQMVDTVNVVLNKSTKRFMRDLNDCFQRIGTSRCSIQAAEKGHPQGYILRKSFVSAQQF